MEFLTKVIEKIVGGLDTIFFSAALFAIGLHLAFTRRNFIAALPIITLGMFFFGFSDGILSWVSGLGADSFNELKDFDKNEAYFWFGTFLSTISQMLIPIGKTSLLLAVVTILLAIIIFIILSRHPFFRKVLIVILFFGAVLFAYEGYVEFKSGRSYVAQLEKQFDTEPVGFKKTANIDLFVYIGESTTTLNMSLYGYPLPTTPELDKLSKEDIGFVHFDGVRSTHSHTSLSLLRALAVTSHQRDGRLNHWGIGSVLKQSGLTPKLYSVQSLNGSFATFSRFVFEGMDFGLPEDEKYKGNYKTSRIKDHELLEKALKEVGVVFFHSYGGHGHYRDFIDDNLSRSVAPAPIKFDGLYGNRFSELINSNLPRNVSDYDRAITYIDRNVAHAIENIKARSEPAVFLYFSDHGEAVFANRGHDSSNYIDEMTTVPVILYFNEAYRQRYPKVLSSYRQAATLRHTRLLDQVSPTILDLLRVQSSSTLDVPKLDAKTTHPRPFILERNTLSGPSRINLNYDENFGFLNLKFSGGTPDPTYIYIINEKFGEENTICYHRANSYGKALRGAAVAKCLEFDLVVDEQGLNVHHPPAAATGFNLEHIFSIAQARKNSLWIDSKNLDDPAACNELASFLEVSHHRVGQILVEFPYDVVDRLPGLQACSNRIKATGARTSYYVPTHLALPCSEDPKTNAVECRDLIGMVSKAMASGNFTDISFDFLGYPAIKRIPGARSFKWNTWTIKAQEFHDFPRKNFGFVIMDASTDPNNY
jgi:glucan phosphoethanolaminetransferase (alkaline phosphatase superfamily)